MKILNLLIPIVIIMGSGCNNSNNNSNMEREPCLFPKGEGRQSPNFNGTTYRVGLVDNIESFDLTVGSVTFAPRVRTNWHTHTNGQILIVIYGNGYYQERGKPVQLIQKGDVVEILADVIHWHGATPDGEMTHLTIRPKASNNDASWLESAAE